MSSIARTAADETAGAPLAPTPRSRHLPSFVQDRIYSAILFLASLSIFVVVLGIALELVLASGETLHRFGMGFFARAAWDPVRQDFGALPFIFGTLYTSFWALLLAVPVSIGAAIFLAEIAPKWLRNPVSFLIELLAAIPSVVYGLWGVFVLAPWLSTHVETPISEHPHLSKFVLFDAPPNGNDILAASLILAIMVLPFITSVSRDILRAIPRSAREGSYALGATQWETIRGVVLPYARGGIIGAVILGLGRALGETMAVTMVIGNSLDFKPQLFNSGYTMASIIANEFSEASFSLYRSALIEIGLALFVVTMVVNGFARVLIYYTAKNVQGGGRRA
jgi:phosphate transport system permease protein